MFQIKYGSEGTILLFSVKTVEIKQPFSLSYSMMTLLAEKVLISAFVIFISCSLSGTLGVEVIPGLSLKLTFRPF